MPAFGGMSPFPLRLGGGRPRVQVVLDGLNADRGDAYNATDRTTTVYVENMAIARAISAAWGTNARLGAIWDANRMSEDILERWEHIFALAPSASDDETTRRDALATKLTAVGSPSIGGILTTALSAALGSAFVAVEHIDYSAASINVPDGTYPWGSVGASPWSSTVAHILVRMQKPAGWTEGQFYAAAAKVGVVLDPALPAWTTFDFYRPGPISSAVAGGPSAAGFYLDDAANLDNEIFD